MPEDVRIWQILKDNQLDEVSKTKLELEKRIEQWIERDSSVLSDGVFIIGRQVPTDFGGFIDLLCLDADANCVIVELMRDKTPREITAQALDYASWVKDLSSDRITAISRHTGDSQDAAVSDAAIGDVVVCV